MLILFISSPFATLQPPRERRLRGAQRGSAACRGGSEAPRPFGTRSPEAAALSALPAWERRPGGAAVRGRAAAGKEAAFSLDAAGQENQRRAEDLRAAARAA